MDLPKNITQIGQSNKDCKIYVEDYVVSYLKQWNRVAANKDIAVALYGIRKEEDQVSYLFLYGACRLDFLQREVRHLSQAQQQEVDKLRVRYFPNYTFLGYRILNGEMIEGFHIGNQGSYHYIAGYAQFYEKNDSMLAYMLDTRTEQPQPEVVDQEKYQQVRKRQEERRAQAEVHRPFGSYTDPNGEEEERDSREDADAEPVLRSAERRKRSARATAKPEKPAPSLSMRRLQTSVAAVFALLCLAGLSTLTSDGEENGLQTAARQIMEELTEQKLPDTQAVANMDPQVDTLVTEDKLVAAVQSENEKDPTTSDQTTETQPTAETATESEARTSEMEASQPQTLEPQPSGSEPQAGSSQTTPESTQQPTTADATPQPATQSAATDATPQPATTIEPQPTATPQPTAAEQPAAAVPVSYVIQKGDTLINICRRQYGTDTYVSEVCALNQITNPDDIKIGQIILLP